MDEPEQSLDDWLNDVKAEKSDAIDFSFPTDKLKGEYIARIDGRPYDEVVGLIRKFLIQSGSLGADRSTLSWLSYLAGKGELKRVSEFQRRLIRYAKTMANGAVAGQVTWVLDLLPDNPRRAIDTLNAYFEAHCLFMPDGRMHGIYDATELIRARFIQAPRSSSEAIRLLQDESARTFERVVERLYSRMGYSTKLTPRQKDGGFDVLALKEEIGRRAKVHIECKKWEGNVGVPILRGLLGVVHDSKATNGVCVTTSDLTGAAKKFVERNPQLDFVSGEKLVQLLNEYLGPTWFYKIERLVEESKGGVAA
ncbi:restriction system protein [Bradyrhizobium japonicum]|uniref:Restriction system protein n=1 Tax=Bradyrhizobium japonicum TaxID=375 RepID=A0ABV2RZV5_BRAJP|nr:restriction endonuclease [Bradyrhizobium japonicum]UQD94664.1 restriction endonuclease [Bradyrhizobium japonicum]WLB15483.1 restriction endonuclease [Bradyrhizobium japonicum]